MKLILVVAATVLLAGCFNYMANRCPSGAGWFSRTFNPACQQQYQCDKSDPNSPVGCP